MNKLIEFLTSCNDSDQAILLDDVRKKMNNDKKFKEFFNHYAPLMDINEFLWICEDDWVDPYVQKILKSIDGKSIKDKNHLKEFTNILKNIKSSNMIPFFTFKGRTFTYNNIK
jgi:hypothetical protein